MKQLILYFTITFMTAISSCHKTPHFKTKEQEISERASQRSYHANEANKIVQHNQENRDERKKQAEKKRKQDSEAAEELNKSKRTTSNSGIPFQIY